MDIFTEPPPPYNPDGNLLTRPLVHCWNRTYRKQVPRIPDTDAIVMAIYSLPAIMLLILSTNIFILTSTIVGVLGSVSEVTLILPVVILLLGTAVLLPSFINNITNKTVNKILYWIVFIIRCIAVLVGLISVPFLCLMGFISAIFVVCLASTMFSGWCLFWGIYTSSVLLTRVHKKSMSEPFEQSTTTTGFDSESRVASAKHSATV